MYAGRVVEFGAQARRSSTTRSTRTRGACSARSRAWTGRKQDRLHSIAGDAAVADRPARRLPLPRRAARTRFERVRGPSPRSRCAAAPRPPRPLLARPRQARGCARGTPPGSRPRRERRGEPLVEVGISMNHFPIRAACCSASAARPRRRRRELHRRARARRSGSSASPAAASRRSARCDRAAARADRGHVALRGPAIAALRARELRPLRREMQMVFQDPYASLNPRMRVGADHRRAAAIHGVGDAARAARAASRELLERRRPVAGALRTATRTSSRAASASASASPARSRCSRS